MKNTLISFIKKILPSVAVEAIRNYRKNKRIAKRFSYGKGLPFEKSIHVCDTSFKIVLDPVKNSAVDEFIAEHGYWEKELSSQMKKYLKKGDVFLDIGANIGYHSLFVASSLQGSGKVYSFEPLSRLCEQLKKSISLNEFSNIEVCNFGLAETDSIHEIYLREENIGGSSVLNFSTMESFKVEEKEMITLKNLDNFLGKEAVVNMIKIDVEGYELEALTGAHFILTKNKPIIFMEFSPIFYSQDYEHKAKDLISYLEVMGYKFFDLRDELLDLHNWLKQEGNKNSQVDIICRFV
jgi:FkbM family methyltransferase